VCKQRFPATGHHDFRGAFPSAAGAACPCAGSQYHSFHWAYRRLRDAAATGQPVHDASAAEQTRISYQSISIACKPSSPLPTGCRPSRMAELSFLPLGLPG